MAEDGEWETAVAWGEITFFCNVLNELLFCSWRPFVNEKGVSHGVKCHVLLQVLKSFQKP